MKDRSPTAGDQRRTRALIAGAVTVMLITAAAVVITHDWTNRASPSPALAGAAGTPTAASGGPGATEPGQTSPIASDLPGSGASSTPLATPTPTQPSTQRSTPPATSRFGLGLLIADRGNGRLLIVNEGGTVLWTFPVAGSLPPGQQFAADDAFIAPDGRTIVANDEGHQVIDRIDIVTRRVTWQFGQYDRIGSGPKRLHTPDDAYPLANGDITVADIRNCRIIRIDPAKHIVAQLGRPGACAHDPPTTFGQPNGDTPLPDGGLLVTEIDGSRVVRLDAANHVVFDIKVPARYPSDAQLDSAGNIVVVDYSRPGAVLRVAPDGRVLWKYAPTSGEGRLGHPSLALPLPDGTIVLNDDFRQRVIVIDPATNKIVWQYGHTGRASTAPGYLSTPDGISLIPVGTDLGPAAQP